MADTLLSSPLSSSTSSWSSGSASPTTSSSSSSGSSSSSRRQRTFVRKEQIGQGAQGCVYRCEDAATGREIACKVILTRDLSPAEVEVIKHEVATVKRLKHPRLVRYLRASEKTGKRLSIYMEFVGGGSLSGELRRRGPLSIARVQSYTAQLCSALKYLHANGIAHRDIKCANVFLTAQGDSIKLGDFGAFKEMGKASLVGGLKGTPHWMAPEVIREPPQCGDGWFRADVWSLGCAVLEMLTGHAPWQQFSNPMTAMYQIVASNNTPVIPPDASDETASFLQACLQRDPTKRATVKELLAHPFLRGQIDSNLKQKQRDEPEATTPPAPSRTSSHLKTAKRSMLSPPSSRHPLSPVIQSTRPVVIDTDDHDNRTEDDVLSPQDRSRPSRIPRLKPIEPLTKRIHTTSSIVAAPSSSNNNNNDDEEEHQIASKAPKSRLPRLTIDKKVPKAALSPELPVPRRAATAPVKDSSPRQEGGLLPRLKLPPLMARAASTSSCR